MAGNVTNRAKPRFDLRLGVLAVQGDVSEHERALSSALLAEGLRGSVAPVRTPADLDLVDGLAMPGGESTAISRLLVASGLHDRLVARARDEGLPLLATCAGLILAAKEGDRQVSDTRTRLLGLLDLAVDRNAFGRQRESFEASVDLAGLGSVPAAFIRAPAIVRTWGACEPWGLLGKTIVAARQGNVLGLCFHPELTGDLRVHRHFVQTCARWKRA